MNYILTHKKIPVMEIEIDEETATISRIGSVFVKGARYYVWLW